MPDCLAAGILVADHVCEPIERMPRPGELVLSPHLHLTIGGCASNVAVDLARLGTDVGIVGCIGGDVFGAFIREQLQQANVQCGGLRTLADCETSGTLVINERGQDRRFIHSVGASSEFTGEEITSDLLASAKLLYVGGYCLMQQLQPQRMASVFQEAQTLGVRTVLDVVLPGPGDFWDRLDPVLPYTDIFLPNQDEALMITGQQDARDQAATFRQHGADVVVVTCGSEGCLVASDEGVFAGGVIPVEPVDGTGSGDAFAAGFIHGLLQQQSLAECVALGTALGAKTVQNLGATGGAMTAAELAAFRAAHAVSFQPVD